MHAWCYAWVRWMRFRMQLVRACERAANVFGMNSHRLRCRCERPVNHYPATGGGISHCTTEGDGDGYLELPPIPETAWTIVKCKQRLMTCKIWCAKRNFVDLEVHFNGVTGHVIKKIDFWDIVIPINGLDSAYVYKKVKIQLFGQKRRACRLPFFTCDSVKQWLYALEEVGS